MRKSVYVNNYVNPKKAILIIDKIGLIGERLSSEYAKDYIVILVTNRPAKKNEENVTRLRFKNKIPKAPENNYIKILIIDNGEKEVINYTNSIAKESQKLNSELYFLTTLRSPNIKFSSIITDKFINTKVFILGDIFDNKIYFEKEASITNFLMSVRKNKKIIVKNDGLDTSYPITLDDTIKLIIKATFIKTPQKIILLFSANSTTDMSLAHMFQKIDPDIDVDFKSLKKSFEFQIPGGSIHAIKYYNLQKKLSDLNLKESKNQKIDLPKKEKPNLFLKPFLIFAFLLIFILLLPLFVTYTYTFIGYQQINSSHSSASKGDFNKAIDKANNSNTLFSFASKSNEILNYQLELLGKDYSSNDLNSKIENGINISSSMSEFFEGLDKFNLIISGESKNNIEDFESGVESFSNSYSQFQKADIKKEENYRDYIKNTFPFIETVISAKEIIPSLLGYDKEMSYIVLFYDSSELMPSGGVVKAVGELRVRDFQVVSFEISDVDNFDQNLNAQIEPPFALRRHLERENSSLKYSGINLDFTSNALNSFTVYKQETGEDVDGLIGVDSYFLKKALEVTGPIIIEGVEGDVSSENIFEVISLYQDKEDLYLNIVKEVVEVFNDMETFPYYSLFQLLGNTIPEQHIFLTVKDSEIQRTLTSIGLSNSVEEIRSIKNNTYYDYFGLYEANLGLNNINNFISRSVSKINNISSDGNFFTEVTITFKNSSSSKTAISKNYKSYLQIALPLGSNINSISVGGQEVEILPAITDPDVYEADGFIAPIGLELRQSVEKGLSVFGFLIVVAPDSIRNVKINYSIPFKINQTSDYMNYSLKVFKQAGIDSYPFNMSFSSNSFNIIPEGILSAEINKNQIFNYLITQK